MPPSLNNPCSGTHPSLHSFYRAAEQHDQGKLVARGRVVDWVAKGSAGSRSDVYKIAVDRAKTPIFNVIGQVELKRGFKEILASREVRVLDKTLGKALEIERENYFQQLNFSRHFSSLEHSDAVQFKGDWLGGSQHAHDYEHLEKWGSNIHRLLHDGQYKEAYARIKAGLEDLLSTTATTLPQEHKKRSSIRSDQRATLYIRFIGDLLRSIPELSADEKTGFAFIQALVDALNSRPDIDHAEAQVIADEFAQTLGRTRGGTLLPYLKVSDLKNLNEKIASARQYASAREFKTSWIPQQTHEYNRFFAADINQLRSPVKEWLGSTRQLLCNQDYAGFQKRLQQVVDTVYTEAERLACSGKGGVVTPAEVIAHPLWQAFLRFMLAVFPKGKRHEPEKRAAYDCIRSIQPSLNQSQLRAAIANVQAERAQLEQLLLVTQELESRGVDHQGEVGLLQLTTMEELLRIVQVSNQVRTVPLWEPQYGPDSTDGFITERKATTKTGANEQGFGHHVSATALVRALAEIPIHYEGRAGKLGHYKVDESVYAEAIAKAEFKATTAAGVDGWSRTWVESGEMAILDPLKMVIGAEVEAGLKAGTEFTFTLNDILQTSAQAELWAGGKYWGEAGAYAGPAGIGFKAKTVAFAGVETQVKSSSALKSRFSQHPAIQGSGTLLMGAGAGFAGVAQASFGGGGEFKVGTSAFTCLGLGAGFEWSISGHATGTKVFVKELAARIIRRFSNNALMYDGLNQRARTMALADRLTELKMQLGGQIEQLRLLETKLQRNLDIGRYRPGDDAVTERIKLKPAPKVRANGSSQPLPEQAKVMADRVFQRALDSHYHKSEDALLKSLHPVNQSRPAKKGNSKAKSEAQKQLQRQLELIEDMKSIKRWDELRQAMVKVAS